MLKKFIRKFIRKKKQNKYMKYRASKAGIISIFTIFIIVVVLSISYIGNSRTLIYKNVYQYINELSEQTATQLNTVIQNQKRLVSLMVETIENGHFNTEEKIFESVQEQLIEYSFTRLVILDKKGNGKTSDGYTVKNYANIEEFFNQEDVYLSENRPSTVTNNSVNIYSKTFNFKGEEKVLMATINTYDYKNILLRRLFGKGGTYLINNEGTVLIDSFDNIKENNANLYEYIKTNYKSDKQEEYEKIDKMANDIKNNKEATLDARFNGETYFIHYERLGINDWYVVTTATNTTIAKELMNLVILSTILCIGITLVITSISVYIYVSKKKKTAELYRVAYIDPVTLLGNEYYFRGKGTLYLEGQTTSNKYIITVDINKFKALNNIYGYAICNEVLKSLGQKLISLLPSDNITCRISNDIFASIFSYEEDINNLLYKISKEGSILDIRGDIIHISLAIGAYNILPNDTSINKIIDKAFLARTEKKGLYDSNYYLFDETLENRIIEEQKIEACMEEALEKGEFKVFYQPKVFTKNEKVSGAEALVRWYRNGEIVPPGKFIPLFERNKFIIKLDRYIFEQACKDLAEWKEKYDVVPRISVNISREQFVEEDFIDKYVEICKKYNLDTKGIDLEITESATTSKDVLEVLNKIKEKGYIVSIDDFGTGTSSLSMLQNMPIDIMKIDKVFVDKANLENDKNIINHIMSIAKHLNVITIIEGVETKEQAEYIKKIGGDIIQGYYYSKPITKEEFEKYFNENM